MNAHDGVPKDEAWFEQFFRLHHPKIRAYVLRRSPHSADDVVAQVFESAWRNRDRLPEHELPWLYRTASNHLLHAYRDDARQAAREQRFGGSSEANYRQDPAEDISQRLDHIRFIETVLDRVPAADAELLRLWAWEELEIFEIAQVLGCSAATARVKLHRARKRCENIVNQLQSDSRILHSTEQGKS